jgi:hypothetical protein
MCYFIYHKEFILNKITKQKCIVVLTHLLRFIQRQNLHVRQQNTLKQSIWTCQLIVRISYLREQSATRNMLFILLCLFPYL